MVNSDTSMSSTLSDTIQVVSGVQDQIESCWTSFENFVPIGLPPARDSSSLSFLNAFVWFWSWLFFKVMNWIILYIPSMIINVLGTNFQISLSLSSILVYLGAIVGVCFLVVRYKYLTRYSQTTADSNHQKKTLNEGMDLVESLKTKSRKKISSSTNYLDEFLSAIKVFGYLERPVFHELTKSMTTQKLSPDEILYLDESLGFTIVVEGTLQVYTKVEGNFIDGDDSRMNVGEESTFNFQSMDANDNELNYEKDDVLIIGDQKYQLLNEVKSGAPLSSLVSTLDLFKLPTEESSPTSITKSSLDAFRINGESNSKHTPHPVNRHDNISPFKDLLRENSVSSLASDQLLPSHESAGGEPIEYLETQEPSKEKQIYPHIVARAKPHEKSESLRHSHHGGATIAIIPKQAFQRVQAKYPKATSHIVTMVLTRLYKVTMNAIHNYLGLTKEIIESEILLNQSTEFDDHSGGSTLPRYLYEGVLEKFYDKDGSKKVAESITPSALSKVSTSTNVQNSSSKSSKNISRVSLDRTSSSRYVVLDSRSKSSHPGDLLSSVPLSRRSDYYQSHTHPPLPSNFVSEANYNTRQRDNGSAKSALTSPTLVNSRLAILSKASAPSSSRLEGSTSTNFESNASSKFENIRDRTFSDEREETEETSLRIAIVENIFKLVGINERSGGLLSSFNISSEQSSVRSSIVGLSSLMDEQDSRKHAHSHYDSKTGRVRFDPLGSPQIFPTSRSSTPVKFFNTINQRNASNQGDGRNADNKNGNSESFPQNGLGSGTSSAHRNSSSYGNAQYEQNFNNVKNEFSKVLDIKYHEPNTTLVESGSFNSGLYYVIDGTLDILYTPVNNNYSSASSKKTKRLYTVKQGGIAGYLNSIVGFRSLVTIKTPKNKGVIVAHIPKTDFSKLMDKYHFLLLPVASKLKSLLSRKILTIDFALEWCHIPAGNVLCSQGDLANGFHIVLSGRFRMVRNNKESQSLTDSKHDDHNYNVNLIDESNSPDHLKRTHKDQIEVLGEYGHGESIGEVEVLTASRRTNSLIAVRDSETTRIPRTLFEMLSLQNPSLMVKVSRIVANRVAGRPSKNQINHTIIHPSNSLSSSTNSYVSNDYKTITILPTVGGLPVRDFADKLVHALKIIGRNVILLDQASTLTHLGRHAFDERLSQLKLSGYFAYLEEKYETIVYVCDTQLKSNWTSTCISQGDCILLLADAEDDVVAQGVGDYERLLIQLKTSARTDLCLIHQDKFVVPGSTSIWLKNRLWVQGHHHIHMEIPRDTEQQARAVNKKRPNLISDLAAKLSVNANPNIKLKFENVKTKALEPFFKLNSRINKKSDSYHFESPQSHKNDFLRLARILSNEGVGLVLGGGGSRGISHVGVVQALEKHGIPVDLIGGTSIGSFVGGLYAKDYNMVSIYGRAKKFSRRVASLWRSMLDLTYPVTSYITGYEFNRGIWKVFGSTEIEDFWIKYFCNSTNITNSTMDIHETGYSWRFIRASMSLAGLLPPIAYNGCMLLDGGYLDNLPVSEMKKKGAKYIIAVDVGSADDRTPMNYGDTLSGFWVLFNRWNPFSKHPDVPNMMDIQMRLAYVASVNALELAKRTPGVIYLRPPIDNYATLDFAKFDEIYHVGLAYADSIFTTWEESGKFPPISGMVDKSKKSNEKTLLYRRNSI